MRITLEMFDAGLRRDKRQKPVQKFEVTNGKELGEFEAVALLQEARRDHELAEVELAQAAYEHERSTKALVKARLDVRRVSER